ncbi:G-X-X-X-Q-X-W domain-containing protein [Coprinopsis sp. MPI-PUGE-AT-0042]|nr:G-X-X-X-Q-X-W domain-containing protein [Coprinopsis sp. MPI-PUGE-AT-0042]
MFILSTILALSAYILGACALAIEKRQTPLTQYIIYNQCPASINLYIGGQNEGVIPQGGNTTRFLSANAGFFYTDANGGRLMGRGRSGLGSLGRRRFYYYLVRDPTYTNVGLEFNHSMFLSMGASAVQRNAQTGLVRPRSAKHHRVSCFGIVSSRTTPLRCPYANTTMGISFCPGGRWPTASVQSTIHPGSNNLNLGKCLDVRGAVFANGTPVQIYDCNGTPAQNWILNRGSTKFNWLGLRSVLMLGQSS